MINDDIRASPHPKPADEAPVIRVNVILVESWRRTANLDFLPLPEAGRVRRGLHGRYQEDGYQDTTS